MSAYIANNALLNAAATPFDLSPSFEMDAPLNVEQHLYNTPANIVFDNQVAVDFLTAHKAPAEFWEQAGYKDPSKTRRWAPGVTPMQDAMEQEREDRILKLEKRMDVMYVVVNSLNDDFSHFALEHWKPFQESLLRYFGHRCHGAYCTDATPHSPIVPPPSSRSRSPSSPIPSLESCSSTSDGGEIPEEKESQESDDSYWSTLSSLRQVTSGSNEVEGGSSRSPGPLWVRIKQMGQRRKDSPEEKGNDEQSGEGCARSEGNTSIPELPDLANTPYIPTHHETNSHASPTSRPSTHRSLTRTHNGPEDLLPPPSTSSEPDVTCRRDDNVDQNESSDSCGSSSSGTSPPSDELGQDSREGMEGEERPDPGGGEGMTGDLQGGSVQ
ncbi:hypothetical protein BJ322DRAFT_1113638 [Thelephora terrestris]|uniref:Uncharacterized protein n=1 Tax=Thelephora terrestris TaxID=56493 RepID=A0A9P6L243_9AGAM|nr:hypothetical protein BJ322DRAFT_1113638 [Thelephora terrestris]